jgi:hypothetical protein
MRAPSTKFPGYGIWSGKLAHPALLLATFLAAVVPFPAQAQDFPRWQFFGGFSYANVDLGPEARLFAPTDKNYYGVDLAVSFNPYRNVGFLFDLGGQVSGTEFNSASPPNSSFFFVPDLRVYSTQVLLGPQFTFRARAVNVFGHALVGITQSSLGTAYADFVRRTHLALGFGGGVDISRDQRFAIRILQFDYIPTRMAGRWRDDFRASTGVVIRWSYPRRSEDQY